MKRWIWGVAILLCGCGGEDPFAARPNSNSMGVRVLSVVDAQTLRVEDRIGDEVVKLAGVKVPTGGSQAKAATAALRKIVNNGTVRLSNDPFRAAQDGNGHRLVFALMGIKNVNVEMVRQGWAKPEPGQGMYLALMRSAEAEAHKAHRGLWANPKKRKR